MKPTLATIILALIFFGCTNTSYNTTLNYSKTKLSVKGTGLSCDAVTMEIAGKTVERNVFYEGEKVTLHFNNFKGLKEVKGEKHPNLSITIKDSKGNILNTGDDLLKGKKLDFSPLKLTAFFSATFNYTIGEKYQLFIKIKDKKGSGVLTAEMPFTIEPNPGIKINKNGLTAKWAYLWDKDSDLVITENEINKNQKYYIIIDSIQGLTNVDGKVFPIIPMEIIDNKNDTLFTIPNLIGAADDGVDPSKLSNLPLTFSLNGNVENPVRIVSGVWDKESDKYIEVITTVKVK